jgi:hypothetical protein
MTGKRKGDRWEKKGGLQIQPYMKALTKALPRMPPPLQNAKHATKPQR